MKITFLGTSDGIPRHSHFCTSTLVEVGENAYLFDAGAPVVNGLFEAGSHPNKLKAFFNTHGHSDHLDGLLSLLTICTWAYTGAEFDLYLPEARVRDAYVSYVENLYAAPFPSERMRSHIFESGKIFDDGFLKVTAIPTRHIEPRPSYAFLLEAEGKRVLLSGDLSMKLEKNDFPELPKREPLDLLVCEMAHFGEDEISPHLRECKTSRLIFNHYQKAKEEHILRLAEPDRFPFPISMAQDGDSIVL